MPAPMRLVLAALLLVVAAPARAQQTPADTALAAAEDAPVEFSEEHTPRFLNGLRALQHAVVYPGVAREHRVEGHVIVRVRVDADGVPSGPMVVRSLTPETDAEALRVVRQARFDPLADGTDRAETVTLPVAFSLSKPLTPARAVAGTVVVAGLAMLALGALFIFVEGPGPRW